MSDIFKIVVIVVIAVIASTVIYRLSPFRIWRDVKPKISLFPKYVAKFDKSVSEIESNLKKMQFNKTGNNIFSRGKVYGDFSVKSIKLAVEVDEVNKQIKVYAPLFGVLFDAGDVWQVTSDIING